MNRRKFLVAGAAGAFSCFAADRKVKFGCQTNAWQVDSTDLSSLLGVLARIKSYGYEGFETGHENIERHFGVPVMVRQQLAATGLRFSGIHISMGAYDPATLIPPVELCESIAKGGAALGAERLIVSGAPARNLMEGRDKVAGLTAAGRVVRESGLRLAYHNHEPEAARGFAELNEVIRATDPELVDFLVDTGHAARARANVASLLVKHHSRICGMHLRDWSKGELVPLGAGTFPLAKLADTVRQTGWSGWLINEEERPASKPGDDAIRPAHDALVKVFGDVS